MKKQIVPHLHIGMLSGKKKKKMNATSINLKAKNELKETTGIGELTELN